jgi:hypothetical protein
MMLSREQTSSAAVPVGASELVGGSPESLRLHPRVPFRGYPFQVRAGKMSCSIRLRDLSCGGASGLCDEPLDVGSFVTICLGKEEFVEAEVRWIERMSVGLKFTHPLAPGLVRRLHQTHGTFVTTRRK